MSIVGGGIRLRTTLEQYSRGVPGSSVSWQQLLAHSQITALSIDIRGLGDR